MKTNVLKKEEPVGGRSLLWKTCLYGHRILFTIGETERIKGSASTFPELLIVYHENYERITHSTTSWEFVCLVNNLFREDKFYSDNQFSVFSLEGPDGSEERKTFETFSQRFRRMYPDYMLDRYMRVVARPETPVINLRQLMALFKSKSEGLWNRAKWMFDGQFRFLDGQPNNS